MELNFVLKDKTKGKFIIEGLQFKDELEYTDVKLYLNDKLYDNSFKTWIGRKLNADTIFEQCINAYIRHDTEDYESFGPEWSVFNKIESLKEYQDDLLIKMPVFNGKIFDIYDLELATPFNMYYSDGSNRCLLLNCEGNVLTDMENFYFEALVEDICKIIKGELKCLYKSENIIYMISEVGGEEGFLEEYDTE